MTPINPSPKRRAARTPLMAALRNWSRLIQQSRRPNSPPLNELLELRRARKLSRRNFLAGSATLAALTATGCRSNQSTTQTTGKPTQLTGQAAKAQVAIVGAGIAGLHAAYILKQAGVHAVIYDAAHRAGGRIYTAHDVLAPGLSTELGGEFIDSTHTDMLALVHEFNLPLLDMQSPGQENLHTGWFFEGTLRSERQILEAFAPIAARIRHDADTLGDEIDFEHHGGAIALDRTPLSDYLTQIGATGWLRKLLEVAYVTENGLDADQQSALNLIFMISTDASGSSFEVFGDSDERYKIQGGNQRITDELAARLPGQIQLGHRLQAVTQSPSGATTLSFAKISGGSAAVDADFVLITIPFSILRNVELKLELPQWKRRAIVELGYGTNAKLFAGYRTRPWHEQNLSGEVFSDEPFQLAWDNSRLQNTTAAGLTLYSGGKPGVLVGKGSAKDQAHRLLPGLDRALPNTAPHRTGKFTRMHWPSNPLTLGSYSCPKVAHWTSISGAEFKPVGNLFFAGEHCSTEFNGFMNGGAETGRRAAEALLAAIQGSPPDSPSEPPTP